MKLGVKKIIKDALSSNRQSLLEPEAKKLISAWDIPVPKSILIKNQDDIAKAVKNLTPPLTLYPAHNLCAGQALSPKVRGEVRGFVLKVVSEDIIHKSEAGGVVTDIKNIKELNNAWTKMVKDISNKMPTARIDGFLLEEMAPKGIEVIIGGLRDPQFGPTVMFGIGGIAVELLKDVSYRIAPLNKKEALDMLKEVKGYPLLTGFRGSKPVDIESLSETIIKLSKILIEMEDIKEIEINPLIVYEKGVMAVDARVVLNERRPDLTAKTQRRKGKINY